MIAEITIAGAEVRFLKHSLLLSARLGDRISTASFDILGEERWDPISSAVAPVVALGGYIHPHCKDEVKIDRAPTPMLNGAVAQICAMGGNSSYLDSFFGGYIATKELVLIGRQRIYRCTAQDYNVLPTQKLVSESYVAKTEQEIIDGLFAYLPEIDTSTYVESSGTTITIDWTRKFLDECLEEVAAIFKKQWYIDFDKYLHYFTPVTTAAPFELSSSPALSTKVAYNDFRYMVDCSKLINKVTVVGDAIVRTRTDATSYAQYGDYFEGKIVDKNIDTNAWADLRGDAELAVSAFSKVRGRLTCYQEGLVIGQKVKIYNFLSNIDDYYLIQMVRLSMINNFTERVDIEYGDYSPNLIGLLRQIRREEEKET